MTQITCPSCGFGFETAATTNTRCRRCRKVVRVGPSRPAAAYAAEDEYEAEPAGAGWVLFALGAAAAFAIWLGRRGG